MANVPVRGRAGVRENGSGAAGKDSRYPVPLALELPMAYGEDAAMKANKAMGANAFPDSGLPNAYSEQLRTPDDAVLPPSNGGQTPIRGGLVAFWVHLNL